MNTLKFAILIISLVNILGCSLSKKFSIQKENAYDEFCLSSNGEIEKVTSSCQKYYFYKDLKLNQVEISKWAYIGSTATRHIFYRFDKLDPLGIAFEKRLCLVMDEKGQMDEFKIYGASYRSPKIIDDQCFVSSDSLYLEAKRKTNECSGKCDNAEIYKEMNRTQFDIINER